MEPMRSSGLADITSNITGPRLSHTQTFREVGVNAVEKKPALDPQASIRAAWQQRLKEIGPAVLETFEKHGPEAQLEEISRMFAQQNKKSRLLKVSNFVKPLADMTDMYMPGALQVAQTHPNPSLLILGGVVCLLKMQSNFQEEVAQVARRLAFMTRKIRIVQRITKQIFERDTILQQALTDLYGDVLLYCARVYRLLTHRSGKPRGKLATFMVSVCKPAGINEKDIEDSFHINLEIFNDQLKVYDRDQQRRTMEGLHLLKSTNEAFVDRASRMDKINQMLDSKKEILGWLKCVDYAEYYENLLDEHLPGTSEWLPEHGTYRKWYEAEESSLLWLSGQSGSGKSFLAAQMVDHLSDDVSLDTAVAYHFLRRSKADSLDLDRFLGSLLHQILQQSPGISSSVDGLRKSSTQSISTLRQALIGHIATLQKVFIVIDGLDESTDQSKLMKCIEKLFNEALLSSANVKILVFSRQGYPRLDDVLKPLADDLHIQMKKDVIQADIDLYVSESITFESLKKSLGTEESDSSRKSLELAKSTVLGRSDGRFLYVSLMRDSLIRARSPKALKELLDTLPRKLNDSYDQILTQLEERWSDEDRSLAHKIILYTYWSARGLTAHEMQGALAMEPGMSRFDPDAIGGDLSDAVELCGNLITVSAGVFELCHASFGDYLDVSNRAWSDPFSDDPSAVLIDLRSHDRLAQACTTCLCLANIEYRSTPFVAYSAQYWDVHVKRNTLDALREQVTQVSQSARARQLFLAQCQPNFDHLLLLQLQRKAKKILTSNSLHLLAAAGLKDSMSSLSFDVSNLVALDEYGRSPCDYACIKRQEEVCLYLMAHGKKLGISPRQLFSVTRPLEVAIEQHWITLFNEILHSTPQRLDELEQTQAIRLASSLGRIEMTCSLLDLGIDPFRRGPKRAECAFIEAVNNGHKSVWKLMLDKAKSKANVNVKDRYGFTAAHLLLLNKDIDGFRAVLDAGADMTARAGRASYMQPAHVAALADLDEVIRLLRRRGISITSKDRDGWQPIHMAARYGSMKALKELMSIRGVRLTAVDSGNGDNLYNIAARYNQPEVIRFIHDLKSAKLLISRRNKFGHAPIHNAAQAGSSAALETLLQLGVDINVTTQGEWNLATPLHVAVSWGRVDEAQILIRHGADITAQDPDGNTALIMAIIKNLSTIAQQLLDAGADPMEKNGLGSTALHFASSSSTPDSLTNVMKLHKGSLDLNIKDDEGLTPMHAACLDGCLENVALLIAGGADMATVNASGESPIDLAVKMNHTEIARMLSQCITSEKSNETLGERTASLTAKHLVKALEAGNFDLAALCLGQLSPDRSMTDEGHRSPIFAAVTARSPTWVEKVLLAGFSVTMSDSESTLRWPLPLALKNGDLTVTKLLLAADPQGLDRIDQTSETALHLALLGGNMELIRLVYQNNPGVVEPRKHMSYDHAFLINAVRSRSLDAVKYIATKLRIYDMEPSYGEDLLSEAACSGSVEITEFVLKNVVPDTIEFQSALSMSLFISNVAGSQQQTGFDLFLQRGADPFLVDELGFCAYDYLGQCSHVVESKHVPLDPQSKACHLRRSICHIANATIGMSRRETLVDSRLQRWDFRDSCNWLFALLFQLHEVKALRSIDDIVIAQNARIKSKQGTQSLDDMRFLCDFCQSGVSKSQCWVCSTCYTQYCQICRSMLVGESPLGRNLQELQELEISSLDLAKVLHKLEAKELWMIPSLVHGTNLMTAWLGIHAYAYSLLEKSFDQGFHRQHFPGAVMMSLLRQIFAHEKDPLMGPEHTKNDILPACTREEVDKILIDWQQRGDFECPFTFRCNPLGLLQIPELGPSLKDKVDEDGFPTDDWLRDICEHYAVPDDVPKILRCEPLPASSPEKVTHMFHSLSPSGGSQTESKTWDIKCKGDDGTKEKYHVELEYAVEDEEAHRQVLKYMLGSVFWPRVVVAELQSLISGTASAASDDENVEDGSTKQSLWPSLGKLWDLSIDTDRPDISLYTAL